VGVVEAAGVVSFVEVGPGSVLSGMVADSVAEGSPAVGVPLLRKGRDEVLSLVEGVGRLHERGVTVDWEAFFAGRGGRRVELPTYAFQRERFWRDSVGGAGGVGGVGHPLLGSVVVLAGSGGVVLSGRLSCATDPWLADHVVAGSVVFPGAGLVELVVAAGGRVGCGRVEELALVAPLVLPESGGVDVQVIVGAVDGGGRREVSVFGRGEGLGEDEAGWVRYASGVVVEESGEGSGVGVVSGLSEWPPVGAEPVVVEVMYEDLAAEGLSYGPAFQGVRAAWRRGEETFAEVVLPGSVGAEAGRFGVHPVLLDAALHVVALRGGGSGEVAVPFAWSGVELFASGASRVRVRVSPVDAGGVRVEIADALGVPVGLVESLVVRSLGEGLVSGVGSGVDGLFGVEWVRVEEGTPDSGPGDGVSWGELGEVLSGVGVVPDVVVLRVGSGAEVSGEGVRDVLGGVLTGVQGWLGEERLAGSRLVVVTEGAVDAGSGSGSGSGEGAGVVDVVGAAVWGLVRSVQNEHPGRVVLV
ncbi:polyketide synthase dehydratase domain-containing protein, partial [Streptomyces ardesiacus]|uniref:polyketide synthase dehydratase domain-containing protein n=3 Tax=Streptomyces TaxID=1883 RepID=UPI003410487D